eukprot:4069609-Pleurochrysis_carterae.AAC.1
MSSTYLGVLLLSSFAAAHDRRMLFGSRPGGGSPPASPSFPACPTEPLPFPVPEVAETNKVSRETFSNSVFISRHPQAVCLRQHIQ